MTTKRIANKDFSAELLGNSVVRVKKLSKCHSVFYLDTKNQAKNLRKLLRQILSDAKLTTQNRTP